MKGLQLLQGRGAHHGELLGRKFECHGIEHQVVKAKQLCHPFSWPSVFVVQLIDPCLEEARVYTPGSEDAIFQKDI